MGRVMQAALLQFRAEQVAEGETAGAIGIVVGNKERVAAEAIAVVVLLSLVLPGLDQMIRHRVVMDRNEQIGAGAVGVVGALDQAVPRRRRGDQPHGPVEAGLDERLLDRVGELEIEAVFGGAAGGVWARHGYGMAAD